MGIFMQRVVAQATPTGPILAQFEIMKRIMCPSLRTVDMG